MRFPIQWVKEGLPGGQLSKKEQAEVEIKVEGEQKVKAAVEVRTKEQAEVQNEEEVEVEVKVESEEEAEVRYEVGSELSKKLLNELSTKLSGELPKELPDELSRELSEESSIADCRVTIGTKPLLKGAQRTVGTSGVTLGLCGQCERSRDRVADLGQVRRQKPECRSQQSGALVTLCPGGRAPGSGAD